MKSKKWRGPRTPSSVLLAVILILFLLILPLLIDNQLSARDQYYAELWRVHECVSAGCSGDFDGDARPERVFIDRAQSTTSHDFWLVVTKDDREIIRLPYWELDNTTRTHAALDQASGKAHLLLYEQKGRQSPTVNAVYAWNGQQMSQIPISEGEKVLFQAMAANDDNGTFIYWVFYHAARVPVLIGYYLLLVVLIFGALRRRRSASYH